MASTRMIGTHKEIRPKIPITILSNVYDSQDFRNLLCQEIYPYQLREKQLLTMLNKHEKTIKTLEEKLRKTVAHKPKSYSKSTQTKPMWIVDDKRQFTGHLRKFKYRQGLSMKLHTKWDGLLAHQYNTTTTTTADNDDSKRLPIHKCIIHNGKIIKSSVKKYEYYVYKCTDEGG